MTHDPRTAAYCERTLRIHRGKIVGEVVTTDRSWATKAEAEEAEEDEANEEADAEDGREDGESAAEAEPARPPPKTAASLTSKKGRPGTNPGDAEDDDW